MSLCACPRSDAADCIRVRTGAVDDFDRAGQYAEDERCECSCHWTDEDDFDDDVIYNPPTKAPPGAVKP